MKNKKGGWKLYYIIAINAVLILFAILIYILVRRLILGGLTMKIR